MQRGLQFRWDPTHQLNVSHKEESDERTYGCPQEGCETWSLRRPHAASSPKWLSVPAPSPGPRPPRDGVWWDEKGDFCSVVGEQEENR